MVLKHDTSGKQIRKNLEVFKHDAGEGCKKSLGPIM